MALQIRRGLASNRTSITPAQGEVLYTTDTKLLYVGDGSTAGGTPVAPVTTVNGLTGNVALVTDNIAEGGNPSTSNKYFTTNRAKDTIGTMLTSGTLSGLTITYDAGAHAITITNTNVIQSGTTNSLAYWASNGTTLTPSANLTWNEAGNVLSNINGAFQITANNGGRAMLTTQTFNNSATGNNYLTFQKARGTNITPTTLVAGDAIHALNFLGYDGTGYVNAVSLVGASNAGNPISTGIVPGYFYISSMDATGVTSIRFRISPTGTATFGPVATTDTGTGGVAITQTVTGSTRTTLRLSNYFSDVAANNLQFNKYRGTIASPTVVVQNDELSAIYSRGYDGAAAVNASSIKTIVDGAVTTGKIPGAIVFSVANTAGTLVQTTKIGNDGTLTHNGSMTTTSTPGTIWNYDSSSSTINLIVGGTVAFRNFSGSILVNCYNSGTVTQYLCGGGSTPIAVGSSKVTPTGTMAATSGISGYTFTATELGLHSFYVIRTRSGA
jgi:hypothetical protein